MKICTKCAEEKSAEDFHKNKSKKSGLADWCKECNNSSYSEEKKNRVRQRYWRDPEASRKRQSDTRNKTKHCVTEKERRKKYSLRSDQEIDEHRMRLRPDGLKRCRKCTSDLDFSYFSENRGLPDGLRADCRNCVKLSKRKIERIADFEARSLTSCVYCGGPYQDIDHVLPTKLGGLDIKENLVPSCSSCNKQKNAKHPDEWLTHVFPNEDIDNLLESWGVIKTWQSR